MYEFLAEGAQSEKLNTTAPETKIQNITWDGTEGFLLRFLGML